MKIALGFKAHSGWAALIALSVGRGEPRIVDRRRIDLIEAADASWAKQPYHAAEELERDEARMVVKRGIEAARRIALREMRLAVKGARAIGDEIVACAVLVGEPMPRWSVDEILAVHFRMHKAEGVLFRDVLVRAGKACGLRVVEIREKELAEKAERVQATPIDSLRETIAALGKSVGPPWGRDQREAALAAILALHGA
ncbi:MAG: hypothetical protein QOJ64_4266 [Acidobacteriota bacterium]|jgi:hypothetical protein|nr:hypothetical protein [Acidobacteriota bacterium]